MCVSCPALGSHFRCFPAMADVSYLIFLWPCSMYLIVPWMSHWAQTLSSPQRPNQTVLVSGLVLYWRCGGAEKRQEAGSWLPAVSSPLSRGPHITVQKHMELERIFISWISCRPQSFLSSKKHPRTQTVATCFKHGQQKTTTFAVLICFIHILGLSAPLLKVNWNQFLFLRPFLGP